MDDQTWLMIDFIVVGILLIATGWKWALVYVILTLILHWKFNK